MVKFHMRVFCKHDFTGDYPYKAVRGRTVKCEYCRSGNHLYLYLNTELALPESELFYYRPLNLNVACLPHIRRYLNTQGVKESN
jgi:hypothetical protein